MVAGVHSRRGDEELSDRPIHLFNVFSFNKFPICASQVLGQDLQTHWGKTRSLPWALGTDKYIGSSDSM